VSSFLGMKNKDLDPLRLRGIGEEPVLYVEGYFGNFIWCEITKIPLNIKISHNIKLPKYPST
jgi:hypothetical protein